MRPSRRWFFAGEARNLKKALGRVAAGEAFLLQGGDCAESFAEHGANNIRDFFRVFLQMAVVLTYAAASPVVKVGRIAGQFAKPRTSPIEKRERRRAAGLSRRHRQRHRVHAGGAHSRSAPPDRGLSAVGRDAQPAARLRQGGYANLGNVRQWMLGFVKDSPQSRRYAELADRISEALGFMQACGLDLESHPELRTTEFYTSHEALLLGYEQAMTREDSTRPGRWYSTSGHMVWIGDRTRQADHAHVEFCRGIKNPLGLKTGPVAEARRAAAAHRHPQSGQRARPAHADLPRRRRQGGRTLPPIVRAVKKEGRTVVWSCDPMHGNTITSTSGYKTRPFDLILKEVQTFFQVCAAEGVYAGGVHLEMTGQNVTECTGGVRQNHRRGPQRPLSHGLRSAAQCRAGDRPRVPAGRPAQAGRPGRTQPLQAVSGL